MSSPSPSEEQKPREHPAPVQGAAAMLRLPLSKKQQLSKQPHLPNRGDTTAVNSTHQGAAANWEATTTVTTWATAARGKTATLGSAPEWLKI